MIGGIGYYCLSDYGIGPLMVDVFSAILKEEESVLVEDLSYSAVAAFHRIREVDARRYILVGAVKRGWEPGSLRIYQINEILMPGEDEVQRFIGESVSGAIDLRSLVYLIKLYGGDLGRRFTVVEVEPQDVMYGNRLSKRVYEALPNVVKAILRLAGMESYYRKAVKTLYAFVDPEGNLCRRGLENGWKPGGY